MDNSTKCCCCGSEKEDRSDNDPWEGRLDDYCTDCALARCDAYPGACKPSREVNLENRLDYLDGF